MTIDGRKNCPLSYLDEIAESSEAKFCKLDDRICIEKTCTVLKAIREKQEYKYPCSAASEDSKNFNKGQFLGPYQG